MKVLPPVLTVEQLAEFLGQDRHELYKAIRAGKIPAAYRAGKRWYIGRDNFLKAMTAKHQASVPPAPEPSGCAPLVDDTEDNIIVCPLS